MVNKAICDAIKNRNILEFTYQGRPRVVEPHAYGVTKKLDEILRCYQIGGSSYSGMVRSHWRLMKVAQIKSLVVTDKQFEGVRSGYARGDKDMSTIYCEL